MMNELEKHHIEEKRINALKLYEILDTPPDGAFDRITALASQLLKTPIAITSLVDSDRIWFKSHHGIDVDQIDREPGLCASAILSHVPYILEDASIDPRSLANPLVAGEMGFRFYAAVPLTTQDNHNLGVLCIIDFKPRTITEEEVAILKTLAQIVMDEMELRLASRNIDKLNQEKSDLLALLSHEIRTPMNGIMGMTELLRSTELTQEQVEYAEVIETSGKSLLSTLNHILDFSKLGSGQMKMNLQPFDIRACVERVIQQYVPETEKKQILVESIIDSAIPLVLLGDDYKIRQILHNVVGNAVKYTKHGRITITVTLILNNDPPECVTLLFTVKDTGVGIENDQKETLFEAFSKVKNGYREQQRGSQLGLPICKQLVEMMLGSIWIEESTNKGSTLAFEIKVSHLK